MKTDREILQMAMNALLNRYGSTGSYLATEAIIAIRKALTRPEQEPVEAWHGDRKVTVYETTVLRSWGPNIESQQEFPRTAQQVQDSFSWLYALQPVELTPSLGFMSLTPEHRQALKESYPGMPAEREPVAAPAAAAELGEHAELSMLNQLIELGAKAAHAHAISNSNEGPIGTAAYVVWSDLRAEMGELIRKTYAASQAAPVAAQSQDALDAARYRWVRGPEHESVRYSRWRIEYWTGSAGWEPMQRERMDDAIDAALASQAKQGGAA